MKKKLTLFFTTLVLLVTSSILFLSEDKIRTREDYEAMLAVHPYKTGPKLSSKQLKAIKKKELIELRDNLLEYLENAKSIYLHKSA